MRQRGRLLRLLVLLAAAVGATAADRVEATTETTQEKTINEPDVTNGNTLSESFNITSESDGPLQCSTQCTRSEGASLRWEAGRRYVYEYEAEGYAVVDVTAPHGPRLRIRATAHLDALSDCRLRLHLAQAVVEERAPPAARLAPQEAWAEKQELGRLLRRRDLTFSYDDGRVHALCPAADEDRWALNVKRGLLSVLQSSGRAAAGPDQPVLERDVSGFCLTHYVREFAISRRGKDAFTLRRFKDPTYCAHRSHVVLPLPAGSTVPAAGAKSPLIGELTCEQLFEDGVLEEATCREMQTLRPFSVEIRPNVALGATAHAAQSLRLLQTTPIPLGAEDAAVSVPTGSQTSLQFELEEKDEDEEEEDDEDEDEKEGEDAFVLLQRLAAAADAPADAPDADAAPALLRRLSAALRRADFPALERLFRRTQDAHAHRRLLLETLPGARTAAAAALLAHLASARALAPEDVDAWLAARALSGAPSAQELVAFAPLVSGSSRVRTLLAAGALVHAHCAAAAPGECARPRSPAADLVGRLERALGPRCRPRSPAGDAHAHAQALLRAIGNAGLLSARGADTLRACYQDAGVPLAVRLAAVEALRRVPCGAVDRAPLLRLLAAPRAPPELRIAAYLGAMRCAGPAVFRAVRDTMLREDLGQVSSFVWSHLRNIQTSSVEWKSELSAFLEDSYLKEKFNTESLKYSRNYETSTYFESLATGASAEANVIFSPASYLPRSAALNLTVEVFGQPLNLLELGGRAEGFEKMAEDAFGPGGFYPDATLRDLLAKMRGNQDDELENSLARLGGAMGDKARLSAEPRAWLYARVFGQEVAFSTLRDAPPSLLQALRQGVPAGSLRGVAALLQDAAVDYTKAFSLDRAAYAVPTSIGLPLRLSLRAGGLLRVRGSLRVNASEEGGGGVRAAAELAPRASLSAWASMALGSRRTARVGVSVRQEARAALYAGADAHAAPGRALRLALRAPTSRLQLLEAHSRLLFVQGRRESAVPAPHPLLINERRVGACSGATLERALGVRACANASFTRSSSLLRAPPPLFPLSGPASLRLALDRTDAFDRYELSYDMEIDDKGGRAIKVRADTPGSLEDRGVWAEARWDRGGPSFSVALRSPAGAAEASVAVARNASAASADAQLRVGGSELLRVAASLRWEGDEDEEELLRLRPELEARATGARPLRLAADLGLKPGARYTANVVLRGAGEPVQLSGELRAQDGGYSVRGEVSCPLLNGSLSGNVTAGPGECASDLRLEYASADGRPHSAAFNHRFVSGFGLIALNASTETTEFPRAAARLQWALERSEGLREHRLRWEREGRVWKSLQRLRMQRQGPRAHLQALAAFSCPQRRIDYKLDLEHKALEGNWSSRAEALLGWKQRYAAGVHLSRAPGPNVLLNAEAATPSVRATLNGRLQRRKHLTGELEGELQRAGGRRSKLSLTGSYKHEGGAQETHQVQLELRGAASGRLRTHVALRADGVEHALRLHAGAPRDDGDRPLYAHLLTYRTLGLERHVVDGTVSVAGRNFSGSVEAVRSPTEHSTIVRLPFSSEIVISTKFLMSAPAGIESPDYDAMLFEVSWDKHLHPSNYVAFNTTYNCEYSRILLDYPNQNILGEIINDPGFLSLVFGWDKNRKIKSEIRWLLENDEGMFSAWINTPFTGLERQNFIFNYTADGQELILHSAAEGLGRRQSVSARAQRRGDAVNAVLTAAGDLAPALHLSLEHDPSSRTGFTADSDDALQVSVLATRRGDGRVGALAARAGGALLPLPECALSYDHPDRALAGALRCDGVLQLHFEADADPRHPKGNFSAWMPRLGDANFHFSAADDWHSAVLDTRDPDGARALYVALEHEQRGARNFSLALEAQWAGRAVRADLSAEADASLARYSGVVSGDLQMALTHVSFLERPTPHFSTEVTLPGGVTANHTFQGEDLLNWESALHVRTGARQGSLQVRQVLNSTDFLHRWDASSGERSAHALLALGFGPDVFPLQVLLQGPQGEPLGLEARLSKEPLLRLSYPPHSLQLSGRFLLDDPFKSGGFSAELLLPQSDPMNVTLSYTAGRFDVIGNATARWGDQHLTADGKVLFEDNEQGTSQKLKIDVQHSASGELLYLDVTLRQPDESPIQLGRSTISTSGHMLGRVAGKEMRVDTHVNVVDSPNTPIGEVTIDVATPFANWTSLNFTYSMLRDSADAMRWKYSVSREEKTTQLVGALKANPSHSLLDVALQYNDAAVASFAGSYDGSDPNNRTLDVEVRLGEQISRLKGGFQRRRSDSLAGGASWHVLLNTPLEGLAHAEAELKFVNEAGAQELWLAARKDAWLLQVNGSCAFGPESSRAALDALLPASLPVRRVGAALDYRQLSPSDHIVVSTVTCDDQMLETNVSVAASDGELAAFLETRSSRDGYGPLSARFNVAGALGRPEGKVVLFELDGGRGGRFNLTAQLRAPSALRVDGRLAAASSFGRSRFFDTSLRYDLEGSEGSEGSAEGVWRRRFAALAVNVSSHVYVMEGEVKTAADRLRANASMVVQMPRKGGFSAHAHYDARGRGALSAAASAATAAGRSLLGAALALNDSVLTAQVVSQPLGLHALTLAASWAPRGAGRYARLHLHLPARQLSVEANASHDLLVSELLVAAWDAGRLHAKCDLSAPHRNVTAVLVRANDTLTLSASLARALGTHADLYLAASRLGRVHVSARLHTPQGSQLDLFVDDRDFDRVLHTSLASTPKEIAVFTESQFRDLQLLNISVQFDVIPAFNHVGLDMEYIAEQIKLPAKLSARIDRKSAFIKLNHFIYKLFPEDMEAILTYDKLLDRPTNPSYVFVLSVNNTRIFRSSAHFVFDWEKEIEIDIKMQSHLHDKKYKLGVGCRCETKFPATVNLNVTDQAGALVAMDGVAVAAARGGFTYRLALSTNYGRQKREALVEYYPKNPLLMSVDTNATSGAETRRYFGALKLDLERALLRLDLVTPVAGYENLTLNWRREEDSFALDAHTTYPGFERVGVRARFRLKDGPAKAASLYVERDGSTVGGALYLEQEEGLLNVSCELELHGTRGDKSGMNFWYDVRGTTKSVEVKLLGTCVHRVAATFATDPGLELHVIADIKKQASSLDVSYNPQHVAFRGVLVGKTVADFNFQRVDSGNDTSVDAKFVSSFVAHPLTFRYDYNILENRNPEIRVFITVSAMEKTSTVEFRMPAEDSPTVSYNIKVDLPDGEWTAEANIDERAIQAKTTVVGHGVDLLHAEMHQFSPDHIELTLSVLDGQFLDARLSFAVTGNKKFSDLRVLRDGSAILNAHLHVDFRDNETMEVIGTADSPNLPLRGFAFNYTLAIGASLRRVYPGVITDGAGIGQWLYFVWYTDSERMATDWHAVIGPQTIVDISVKDGKTHLFLYNLKFYTLQKESPETTLNMQLKLKELEWKFYGVTTSHKNRISGVRLEAMTPWSELQRLVFNMNRIDAFDLKLLATSHNKDAQLTAKMTSQDGTFASAELSLPDRPKIAALLNAKGGRSPALILEVTLGQQSLKAEASATPQKGGRVDAYARLSTPWSDPWSVEGTYENNSGRVRTLHGLRTVAEAEGEMNFFYDGDVSFYVALEGALLDKKVRAVAGWRNPEEGESTKRTAHLEWESEGAIVKFQFQAEPKEAESEQGTRKFSGSLAIVSDSIVLHGSANGTWPRAVAVAVRTGDMQEAYEASYDFRTEGHNTDGEVVLKTLIWEPLQVQVTLTEDTASGRQEVIFTSRGYRARTLYSKNVISDTIFELSDTSGPILSLKNLVTNVTYNAEMAWREKSALKKVTLSLRIGQSGKFELTTPWNTYALANWNHVDETAGQALLHWNGMDLKVEYERTLPFTRVLLSSPWGAVHLRQVREMEHGTIAFMVDDSTGQKQVLYAKYEYDDQMHFALHVWREALHKVEMSFSPDLRRVSALLSTPRLHVEAGVEARTAGWSARLHTGGELAPSVEAQLNSDDAHFLATASLPDTKLHAEFTRLPEAEVTFSVSGRSLRLDVTAGGGARPWLEARAQAEGAGEAQLEARRGAQSARLNIFCAPAGGRRQEAQAAAQWGNGNFSLEAKAGDFAAGLALGASPMHLHVHVGNATLLVRDGLALVQARDGRRHSLEWRVARGGGRVALDVQLECAALLPERAQLHLQLGPHPDHDGGGAGAEVRLAHGAHHHAVQLRFRRSPRAALEARVDADGRELLALNSSLAVADDQVDAALHLRFRDTDNSLEVTHRLAFPVHSSIAARSPLLLAAERVSARLLVDGESLEAEASRGGEWSARRFVAVRGAYSPERRTASLAFDSSDVSHVRAFGVGGALHADDLGFDADAHLATGDGAALVLRATAALSADQLKAEGNIVSRTESSDKKYTARLLVPLRVATDDQETTLQALLALPDAEYLFQAECVSTAASLSASAVARAAPGAEARATLALRRRPSLALAVQLDSPVKGWEHLRLAVNERLAQGDTLAHYVEWGASRVELRHRFLLQERLIASEVQLTTPFKGHELYALQVAYQNGEQKVALARVSYPGLERALGLELEYRVRGLFDASVRAAFHAPFLPRLRSAALAITHVLHQESGAYVAALAGEVDGRTAGVNVTLEAERGAEGAAAFRGALEAERDGERVWLRVRGEHAPDAGDVALSVDVSSVARVAARWGRHALLASVVHRDRLLFDLNATTTTDVLTITCVNPFRPVIVRVSSSLFMLPGRPMDVGLQLGWERDGELKTRVAVGATGRMDRERRTDEVQLFVTLPGRSARAAFADGEGVWERNASLTWGGNRTLGYTASARHRAGAAEGVLRVQLPSGRAFEARAERRGGAQERQGVWVLWDAARDRGRRVGYELRRSDADGLELTLLHPLLGDGARVGVRGELRARDARLRAACDVRVALLKEPALDWRAGAALDLRRGASGGGGRAAVTFHVADRTAGREARAALDASLDAQSGAALLLNVTYTPADVRPATLLTELRAAPTLLLLRTRAPDAALELSARAWDDGAELLARVDDRDAVRAKVQLEASERAVEATLALGGGLRYRARAAAPHRRRLDARLWAEAEGGDALPAGRLQLELKTPRLLSVRARLPPPTLHVEQVWQLMQQELERVPRAAAAAAEAHARLWQTRWDARVPWPQRHEWLDFSRAELDAAGRDVLALADDAAALFPDVAALIGDASGPAAAFWGDVRRFAATCGHVTLKWTRAVLDAVLQVALVATDALGFDAALPALGDALAGFKEQAVAAHAAVLGRAGALLEGAGAALAAAGQRARDAAALAHRRLAQPASQLALAAADHLAHAFFELSQRFTELSNTVLEYIMEVKELRAMKELGMETLRWLDGPFRLKLAQLFDTIENVTVLVLSDLQESLRLLWERVQQAAPSLSPAVREIYNQVVWVLETYVATPQNAAALRAWSQQRRTLRPESGEMELEQELPVDWEGFDRAPRFEQLRELGGSAAAAVAGPADLDRAQLDPKERLLYTLKELTAQSPRALAARALSHSLPAFSAVGQLLGARHVITFDGNAFALRRPRCTYLLAGDLVRNSFAVLVHFNGQTPSDVKRTFTILTPFHAVHVDEAYAVRVDGRALELPARATPLLAVRRWETALEVAAPGFAFRCRVDRHACSVRVSGWHFGRVSGLLGSFDRERARDLEVTHAVEVMEEEEVEVNRGPAPEDDARETAWRVGRCRDGGGSASEEDIAPRAPAPRGHDSPACKQVLESASSPLSECFARVDPSPYAALCAVAGPCDAALAYQEACRLRTSFAPSAPPECESCAGVDGAWLAAGSAAPVEAAEAGVARADVVVVAQAGCAGRLPQRAAAEALPRLAEALAARGLRDARFALVSYGGSGSGSGGGSGRVRAAAVVDWVGEWLRAWRGPGTGDDAEEAAAAAPRLHTSAGRVWADARAVQETLHRVLHGITETEIPQEHSIPSVKTYSLPTLGRASPGEAERAVAAGAALRARAGAGRAVLLLQCGACQRDRSPALEAALAAAAAAAGGAPLHVLRPDALLAPKTPARKAARFAPGDALALAPSADRRRGLDPVVQSLAARDACTAPALEGGKGGSVTEAAAWPQERAQRLLGAWAEHVARSVRPPAHHRSCQRFRCAAGGRALCVGEDVVPQNSEEADEQFLQFLQ